MRLTIREGYLSIRVVCSTFPLIIFRSNWVYKISGRNGLLKQRKKDEAGKREGKIKQLHFVDTDTVDSVSPAECPISSM